MRVIRDFTDACRSGDREYSGGVVSRSSQDVLGSRRPSQIVNFAGSHAVGRRTLSAAAPARRRREVELGLTELGLRPSRSLYPSLRRPYRVPKHSPSCSSALYLSRLSSR